MASRRFDDVQVIGLKRVGVTGRFFPQGTNPVVNTTNKGKGYTITRTGAGLYLITLADKYNDLIHFGASVQATTATSWTAAFGVYTNPSTTAPATIELFTRQGGGLLDVPAGADNSVAFWLTFQNTSVAS